MNKIAQSSRIFDKVKIGKNVVIEDFCLIGVSPEGTARGTLETQIGDNVVIKAHTVLYAGTIIGNNVSIHQNVQIREECKIGEKTSIGPGTIIENNVEVLEDVKILSQVFIPEFSLIKAGAWLGPQVVLTNSKYPDSPNSEKTRIGPTIEEKAILGANSTILPGLSIGKESLVGAGSVVTKNIPDKVLVAGNPAKITKDKKDLPYD